ncbi:MAG: small ribosomal subunit Rsm22 family protein [Verrucomicrobiota bacterium JB022]|nr:small ribosomal subunit Rsm22 family protein [Verrucomicrobiota bacterium JB022]
MMTWDELDYARLETLRARFLERTAGEADYWTDDADLAAYDLTFAERIGWKWDAVLRELALRQWQAPRHVPVVDWGCGSGIALRRWLQHMGFEGWSQLIVSDRSARAMRFAEERLRARYATVSLPQPEIRQLSPEAAASAVTGGVLLVSHVLNELDATGRARLLDVAAQAQAVVWVEPGSYDESRALIQLREALMQDFRPIAPCTHAAGCGMLTEENNRHWCHHFGRAPVEAFTEGHWARFGQWLGIDLRSLPYSFLVLERRTREESAEPGPGWSRVIGHAREYKGYLKLLNCQAEGVEELMMQKRDAKALHKHLRKEKYFPLYRWRRTVDKVIGGEAMDTDGLL